MEEVYEWTKVDISDEAQKEFVDAMIENLERFEGLLLDPSASSAQIIACDHDSGNKEL
jgi:hypothetical protein